MAIKKLHTVKQGENVSLIASSYQVTVTEIVNANPNVFSPSRIEKSNATILAGNLVPGGLLIYPKEVLKIPSGALDEVAQKQVIKADNSDDLLIYIRGQKCPNPNTFKFTEYFDTCSDSFEIEFPFTTGKRLYDANIDNLQSKGLPDIKIYIGEDPALTGEIEKIGHSVTVSSATQTLGGRTKTRLLEKSETMPGVQVDFIDLTIDQIAKIFCDSHGLKVKLESGVTVGDKFDKATRSDNEKPFNFISKLARERKLITSNTPEGECLLRRAVAGQPVARFEIGQDFLDFLGVSQLNFEFDTTEIYGNLVAKTQTDDNDNASSAIASKILSEQSVKRYSFKDSTQDQLQGLVEREEKKSVRDFYKNSIPFPSWLIPGKGRRWKTGDIITLVCPEAGITIEKRLIIRQIEFSLDNDNNRVATLNFVPIEVYL